MMKTAKVSLIIILITAFLAESAGVGYLSAVALAKADALRPTASVNSHSAESQKYSLTLPYFTEETIGALEKVGGDRGKAAEILKISYDVLYIRIRKILAYAILLDTPEARDVKRRLKKITGLIPNKRKKLPTYTAKIINALEATSNMVEAAKELKIPYGVLNNRIIKILIDADTHNTKKAKKVLKKFKKIIRVILQNEKKLPRYIKYIIKTINVLEATKGSLKKAAEMLDISYVSLFSKIIHIQDILIALDNEEAKALLNRLAKVCPRNITAVREARQRRKALKEMVDLLSRYNYFYNKNEKRINFKGIYKYSQQEIIDAILGYPGLEREDLVILSKDHGGKVGFYAGQALDQYDETKLYNDNDDNGKDSDVYNYLESTYRHMAPPITENTEGVSAQNFSVCGQLAHDLSLQGKELIENEEFLQKLFEMADLTPREKTIVVATIGYDEPYESINTPLSSLAAYFKISRERVSQIREAALMKLQHAAKIWNRRYDGPDFAPVTTHRKETANLGPQTNIVGLEQRYVYAISAAA